MCAQSNRYYHTKLICTLIITKNLSHGKKLLMSISFDWFILHVISVSMDSPHQSDQDLKAFHSEICAQNKRLDKMDTFFHVFHSLYSSVFQFTIKHNKLH